MARYRPDPMPTPVRPVNPFRGQIKASQFVEAGLPGPTKRTRANLFVPTARIARILSKELGIPVVLFWHHAAKLMLEKVSESRARQGDERLPDILKFTLESDHAPAAGPYARDIFEQVRALGAELRRGKVS